METKSGSATSITSSPRKADRTLGWSTSTTGSPQAIISFGMRE